MTGIGLWHGDICDLEVDAIVNPATMGLWMTTGVASAIKRRGGDSIEFEAVRLAPVPLGESVVTGAGRLACRYIIHAVSLGPDRRTNAEAIDAATRSALHRARELGIARVAFPALGTGVGRFPLEEAARIMVAAVREELEDPGSIEQVIFALRGAEPYFAFDAAIAASAGGAGARLVAQDGAA